MSVIAKVRRNTIKLRNRLTDAGQSKIRELSGLLASPPSEKTAVDVWAGRSGALINEIVLDRVSKEDLAMVLAGLVSYRRTGITPHASQAAMIRAYENSSGLFQEILHNALFDWSTSDVPAHSRTFGQTDSGLAEKILSDLKTEGYSVLPTKISPELVRQMQLDAQSFDYRLREGLRGGQTVSGIDPANPPSCISAYSSSAPSPAMQAIIDDEFLTYIASSHLGTPARAIDSTLWYTFPNPDPSSETAQLFHYDLDTIRWIKVFVYLSDVGPANGPHEYVPGTHIPENKERKVMLKEYGRISDAEIDQYYAGRRRKVEGPAGTVIIGDTRCFHKGNAVSADHRLIFSPIFAPSRIGYFHG